MNDERFHARRKMQRMEAAATDGAKPVLYVETLAYRDMSRNIRCFVVDRYGRIENVTMEVAALLGCALKINTENLAYFTLSGAGFEAAYHVADRVNMFADTDYRGERL
jgi:hypothetical protein